MRFLPANKGSRTKTSYTAAVERNGITAIGKADTKEALLMCRMFLKKLFAAKPHKLEFAARKYDP